MINSVKQKYILRTTAADLNAQRADYWQSIKYWKSNEQKHL